MKHLDQNNIEFLSDVITFLWHFGESLNLNWWTVINCGNNHVKYCSNLYRALITYLNLRIKLPQKKGIGIFVQYKPVVMCFVSLRHDRQNRNIAMSIKLITIIMPLTAPEISIEPFYILYFSWIFRGIRCGVLSFVFL